MGARRLIVVATTGLVGYLLFVAAVAFWPTPVDAPYESQIDQFLGSVHALGIPETFGYHQLERLGNILFFVPVGFFIAAVLPIRLWWLGAIIGCGVSVLNEWIQGAFLPARTADLGDILANTVGAIVGALAVTAIRLIRWRLALIRERRDAAFEAL